jgi:undecaprenyl-diphosphatase
MAFLPFVSRRLAGVALICLAVVALLALLISAGLTRPIDVAVIEEVRSAALRSPLAFLQTLTIAGSTTWITGMALLIVLVELVGRRPWLGIAAAATIGMASLINAAIKVGVARARPDFLPPLEIEPGYSFPSGHSALSAVAYGILITLVLHSSLRPAVKAAITTALVALILLVGFSRVYLGVHYPSDVLGGWLSGAAVTLLFEALVRSWLVRPVSREASKAPVEGAAAGDRGAPRSDPPVPE